MRLSSLVIDFLLLSLIMVGGSHVVRAKTDDLDCDDPKGYSVEEDPETNTVKIVRDGTVFHTIKLRADGERNGVAFNGVKKTKAGFEMSVEYGCVSYHGKTLTFVCKQHTV